MAAVSALDENFHRKEIKSFGEFEGKLDSLCSNRKGWLFRGQGLWAVPTPRYFRSDSGQPKAHSIELERSHIAEFRKKLGDRFPTHPVDDWWVLTWLQHYHAPTRLLDWTCDPFIALWFAAYSRLLDIQQGFRGSANRLTIWMLKADLHPFLDSKVLRPSDVDKTFLMKPPELDVRVLAQQSIFSVHSMPSSSIDCVYGGWSDSVGMLERGELISLFADDVLLPEIFEFLKSNGISFSSVYPDLNEAGRTVSTIYAGAPELRRLSATYAIS
jgi:hypothetical protein